MAEAEVCPRCGARFECGMRAGRQRCWCAELPPLQRAGADAQPSCYCPACLKELLELQAQSKEASA